MPGTEVAYYHADFLKLDPLFLFITNYICPGDFLAIVISLVKA